MTSDTQTDLNRTPTLPRILLIITSASFFSLGTKGNSSTFFLLFPHNEEVEIQTLALKVDDLPHTQFRMVTKVLH